jgi:NADH-quinone oxidoreductase subunit F
MDFDTIMKAGSRMGTGLIMAVDDRQTWSRWCAIWRVFRPRILRLVHPCRDGLPWTVKILSALERGEGQAGEIEILEQIARQLGPGKTFCAHAPGAVEPLQSAIKFFREEFERGIAAPEAERA